MRSTLLLFALATACAPALALDCKNAMNTPEMNECAALEQKAVEAKLNQVYRRVIKSLDTTGGVKKAHILDAGIPHALLLEIFTDKGIGTEVVK